MSLVIERKPALAFSRTTRIRFWVGVVVAILTFAIWWRFWNVTVISYGDPSKTFFDTTEANPGQKIGLWLGDVKWLRVCPSQLHSRVTCRMADPLDHTKTIDGRIDFEPHVIDVPAEPGRIPLKKRGFIVPDECLPGPMTWSAQATSYCFPFGELNPRTSYPPDLHLTIK